MAWVDKELQEKVQTAEEIYRNAEERIREKLEPRRQEGKQGEKPDDLEISLDTDSKTYSDSTSEPAPQDSEENVKSDNSFSEIEHGRHPSRLNPNYGKVWNWHKAWNLSSNFSLPGRWHWHWLDQNVTENFEQKNTRYCGVLGKDYQGWEPGQNQKSQAGPALWNKNVKTGTPQRKAFLQMKNA